MTSTEQYTDESLTADLTSGSRGHERRAKILLAVPQNVRAAIVAEAWYIDGRIGGRPSDNLYLARSYWLEGRKFASPVAAAMLAEVAG